MNTTQLERLRVRWDGTLASLGVSGTRGEQTFADLVKAYGDTGRYYHNLDHLEAVLCALDSLADQAVNRPAIELALWFHDAIYDPRAADNEERSALFAEQVSAEWGLSPELSASVGRLIRATRTHVADDPDAQLLLDIDLAILGAESEEYDRYAAAIRREYAWVPEQEFRLGRARILRNFLERPRIYQVERLHQTLEAQARINLERELEALSKQ